MRTRHVLSAAAVAAMTAATLADGLWQDFYRGLELLTTPSGGPLLTIGDGSRVNGARLGRVRIVPNRVGKGYDIEIDRNFGNDSRGRPEVLDLGPLELELSGGVQSTLGYTSRFFLIGNAQTTFNNLSYTIRGKTGGQDVELTGTLTGNSSLEVNQFGFYRASLDVSNINSQLTLDGVAIDDAQPTNFTLGTVNVEGNVFYDAFLALLASVGVDTTELAALTPDSPIDRITESIQEQLRGNQLVAGTTFAAGSGLSSETLDLLTRAQSVAVAQALGLPLPPEMGDVTTTLRDAAPGGSAFDGGATVPEPSGWLLLVIGTGVWISRRRR